MFSNFFYSKEVVSQSIKHKIIIHAQKIIGFKLQCYALSYTIFGYRVNKQLLNMYEQNYKLRKIVK